jgi:hypothetical protein
LKTKLLYIACVLYSLGSSAQYTQIPDPGFEQWLIDNGGDSEGILNGQTLTADISGITEIEILDAAAIIDFTGLQDFASLEMFECALSNCTAIDFTGNPLLTSLTLLGNDLLTNIDLSNCVLLDFLFVNQNKLQSLDVTNNSLLTSISCSDNQIEILDISNNPVLRDLLCPNNNLTTLIIGQNDVLIRVGCAVNELETIDTSGAIVLERFSASSNKLKTVDLRNGNNTNISEFSLLDNPELQCVYVDDVNYSNANWVDGIDDPTVFAADESECALGLENISETAISIYPNPAFEQFSIVAENILQIELYFLKGERLLKRTHYTASQPIDISSLAAGVYILKLQTPQGISSRKLVKR